MKVSTHWSWTPHPAELWKLSVCFLHRTAQPRVFCYCSVRVLQQWALRFGAFYVCSHFTKEKNIMEKKCKAKWKKIQTRFMAPCYFSFCVIFLCREQKSLKDRAEWECGCLRFCEITLTVLSSKCQTVKLFPLSSKKVLGTFVFHFCWMHNLCTVHLLLTTEYCTWKSDFKRTESRESKLTFSTDSYDPYMEKYGFISLIFRILDKLQIN